jgi:hypothetical protein
MTFPSWAWLAFTALVAVLLFLDLFVFHRGAREVPFREAMWLSGFWIAISLAFGGSVWAVAGPSAGGEYLAAYLIEKSLSLDNVFVFAVIFSAFAVPRKYRYHVLFWGVIGALVARAVFILAGTSLLSAFDWLVFVFTALRMFRGRDEDADPHSSRVLELMRRILPTTRGDLGHHLRPGLRAGSTRRHLQRLYRVLFQRLRRVGPEGALLRAGRAGGPLRLPALSDATSAYSARCLCGRDFVFLEGVRHRLLEGHRPSLGPRLLEGLLAQPRTRGRYSALVERTIGLVVVVDRRPDGL